MRMKRSNCLVSQRELSGLVKVQMAKKSFRADLVVSHASEPKLEKCVLLDEILDGGLFIIVTHRRRLAPSSAQVRLIPVQSIPALSTPYFFPSDAFM